MELLVFKPHDVLCSHAKNLKKKNRALAKIIVNVTNETIPILVTHFVGNG